MTIDELIARARAAIPTLTPEMLLEAATRHGRRLDWRMLAYDNGDTCCAAGALVLCVAGEEGAKLTGKRSCAPTGMGPSEPLPCSAGSLLVPAIAFIYGLEAGFQGWNSFVHKGNDEVDAGYDVGARLRTLVDSLRASSLIEAEAVPTAPATLGRVVRRDAGSTVYERAPRE